MTKTITIVTSNKGKIHSLTHALEGLDFQVESVNLDLLEPQYDTVDEVAEYKAKDAFKQLQKPLIVHDGGLVIPSLNGFPGVYTKYVSQTLTPQDFVNLMKDKQDKSCYLMQTMIYVDEKGDLHKFQDKLMGKIADYVSTVQNDIGWGTLWQVFIPKGADTPLAEIPEEELDHKIRPIAKTNSVWEDFKSFLIKEYNIPTNEAQKKTQVTHQKVEKTAVLAQKMDKKGQMDLISLNDIISHLKEVDTQKTDENGKTVLHHLCADNSIAYEIIPNELYPSKKNDYFKKDHRGESPLSLLLNNINDNFVYIVRDSKYLHDNFDKAVDAQGNNILITLIERLCVNSDFINEPVLEIKWLYEDAITAIVRNVPNLSCVKDKEGSSLWEYIKKHELTEVAELISNKSLDRDCRWLAQRLVMDMTTPQNTESNLPQATVEKKVQRQLKLKKISTQSPKKKRTSKGRSKGE